MKSIEEQLSAAHREAALRRNAYRKWVASGKMTQMVADHEIECMESIITTLERYQEMEYRYHERLGMVCEDRQPTTEEKQIALKDAKQWLEELVNRL